MMDGHYVKMSLIQRNGSDNSYQEAPSDYSTEIPKKSRFRRHVMTTLYACSVVQLACGIASTCFPFIWAYANIGQLYFVGSTVMCGTIFWIAGIFGLIAHKSPNPGSFETTYMTSLAAAVATNYLIAADIISELTAHSVDFEVAMGFYKDNDRLLYIIPLGKVQADAFAESVRAGRALTRLSVGFTAIIELFAAIIATCIVANRRSDHQNHIVQNV